MAQQSYKPCLLQGTIKNAEGEWLYVHAHDYSRNVLVDSTKVVNGSVTIRLSFEEPTTVLLVCKDKRARTVLAEGRNNFTWDIEQPLSFAAQDNGINKIDEAYMKSLEPLNDRMVEISRQRRRLTGNDPAHDSLDQLQAAVQGQYRVKTKYFIRRYRSNFAALQLLRYYYDVYPVDTVRALYALLDKSLKRYPAAKTIQSYLDLGKKKIPLDRLAYTHQQDSVAGFRYYVVDFWGTWCGPCIAAIPAVQRLYKTYRPQDIQFISIAYERKDLKRYHEAQAKYRFAWPQAYVLSDEGRKTLETDYHINSYPTYLILDRHYRIRHRIADHEKLEQKLRELTE